jgi:hypothetical protein
MSQAYDMKVARDRLIAERDALRTALNKYGQHEDECMAERYSDEGVALECSCGLFQALRSVK